MSYDQTTEASPGQQQEGSILDQIEVATPKALEGLTRAEIDIQIATAKRFPRVLSKVLKAVREMATIDQETAAACFYSVPRQGQRITGPSIRLAEILLSAWGNVRSTMRIVDIGDDFLTARGEVFDLETNSQNAQEVVRRIKDKHGKRYGQDMIQQTAQAAASIALRNAVFRVIPLGAFSSALRAIQDTAVGEGKTIEQRRADAVSFWEKQGVPRARMLAAIGRADVPDITLDDLMYLLGVLNSIKAKEITLDEAFPKLESETPKGRLRSAIQNKAKEEATAPPEAPPAESPDPADSFEDQRKRGEA